MFEDQAIEKSDLLEKLGAKVERLKNVPITHPDHFTNRARIQASKHAADAPGGGRGFFADQFDTDANWRAHFEGTGPEIFEQTDGCIDAFVAGAGTGGIISGVALYLKPRLPKLKVLLADPEGSGLLNRVKFGLLFDPTEKEGTRRRHQINSIVEGIGVNVITGNFEAGGHLIDDAIRVTDNQALAIAKWLVEKDGMFLGSSSAVNCFAAVKVAQALGPGHTIVTILCDSGARHLSKFWKIAGSVVDRSNTRLEDVMSTS